MSGFTVDYFRWIEIEKSRVETRQGARPAVSTKSTIRQPLFPVSGESLIPGLIYEQGQLGPARKEGVNKPSEPGHSAIVSAEQR